MIETLATTLGYGILAAAIGITLYTAALQYSRTIPRRRALRQRIQAIVCESVKENGPRRARGYCCGEIPCLYDGEHGRLFDVGINTHH